MAEWSPEVEVDIGLARRLVAEQLPALAGSSLRLLATGWDNTVYVADGAWTIRFPRRAVAVAGVEREIALLPRLAPRLPLPIPVPTLVGAPSDDLGYPWPWFVAPLIEGREVADADPSEAQAGDLAAPLGGFLRALHDRETLDAIGAELPVDPVRRADMGYRVPFTRQRLGDLERRGMWDPPPSVQALLAAAEALPPAEATAVVHGDLHLRHLLLADDGRIGGIIDWGDLARSDPAVDLVLAWSLVPPPARRLLWTAYGPVSEPMRVRSRVLSLFLCATLAIYAADEGLPALRRASLAALDRTMRDI